MIYGYARVSTKGQLKNGNSLEDQDKKLKEHGAQEIIAEQFTGSTTDRPKLDDLVNKLKSGDMLVVTKLDRLARNTKDGIELISKLIERGITINVLNVGILDNKPMGKFFITTLLAVAELERSMILERVQAGKEIARTKAGFREGRPPLPESKKKTAVELIEKNHYTHKEAAEATGLSLATINRALRKYRDEQALL